MSDYQIESLPQSPLSCPWQDFGWLSRSFAVAAHRLRAYAHLSGQDSASVEQDADVVLGDPARAFRSRLSIELGTPIAMPAH